MKRKSEEREEQNEWMIRYKTLKQSLEGKGSVKECQICPANRFLRDEDDIGLWFKCPESECGDLYCDECALEETISTTAPEDDTLLCVTEDNKLLKQDFRFVFQKKGEEVICMRCFEGIGFGFIACRQCNKNQAIKLEEPANESGESDESDGSNWDGGFDGLCKHCLVRLLPAVQCLRQFPNEIIKLIMQHLLAF